jgi:hypothetical protein
MPKFQRLLAGKIEEELGEIELDYMPRAGDHIIVRRLPGDIFSERWEAQEVRGVLFDTENNRVCLVVHETEIASNFGKRG